MQFIKAITMAIMGGIVCALLFLVSEMIYEPVPTAQATPAIGKGQPCKTCHTSSRPSKSDLTK